MEAKAQTEQNIDELVRLRNFTYMSSDISGQSNQLSYGKLYEQYKIIESEVEELANAISVNDDVEILDGAIDSLVTVLGMIRRLEKLGYDVDKAMLKVGQNNLTKFPTSLTVVDDSVKMYAEQGVKITPVFSHLHDRWALIDENGKYRKPINYKSVDLTDCVPKGD